MSKVKYRFFAGFMKKQEDWLNSMSDKGYRLVKTGKLRYEFEECEPGRYRYAVEYVGDRSYDDEKDYKEFLEDMGYRVFYKNINLDYSLLKVTYRPWAGKGGRISTNRTTYNKELLIVEKENDGTEFRLHTEKEDLEDYYRRISYPWYFAVFLMLACAILTFPFIPLVAVFSVLAVLSAIPIITAERSIKKMKKESELEE